jgi:hypothetical protein
MSTSVANLMQQSSLLKPKVTQHDEIFPIVYVSTNLHWVKFTLELVMKAQKGSRGRALLFL